MRYGWVLHTVIGTAWQTNANANNAAGHGTASECAPSNLLPLLDLMIHILPLVSASWYWKHRVRREWEGDLSKRKHLLPLVVQSPPEGGPKIVISLAEYFSFFSCKKFKVKNLMSSSY